MRRRPRGRLPASAVVKGLLQEGRLPLGSIIDAGANTGTEACYYASLDSSRIVHAVDPLLHNVEAVRRRAWQLPNVKPLLGGFGAERKVLRTPEAKNLRAGQQISIASTAPGESPLGGVPRDFIAAAHVDNHTQGKSFNVWSVDELFDTLWRRERLGFAHWDTEGNELDILRGAERTLQRDMPVFTVECIVHKQPSCEIGELTLILCR